PDQIEDQREQRKAQVLAQQRYQVIGECYGRVWRDPDVEDWDDQRNYQCASGKASPETRPPCDPDSAAGGHRHGYASASAMRPLRAKRPRGRRWMNKMIAIRTTILPRIAPATGSRNLLTMPRDKGPTRVPSKLPTPPNTTTRKLSTM